MRFKILVLLVFSLLFVWPCDESQAQEDSGGYSIQSTQEASPSPEPSPEPSPSPSPELTLQPSPQAEPSPTPEPQTQEQNPKPEQTESPAPSVSKTLDKSKAQKGELVVRVFPQKNVFVGTETIRITYLVLAKTNASFDPEAVARVKMEPFSVVSLSVGRRIALVQAKDTDFCLISMLVRLKDGQRGKYVLPPLRIPYVVDETIGASDGGAKKASRQKEAFSGSVTLEKVAVYVETDTLHEVSFIGQENHQTVTIHADAEAEILNETPPDKPREDVTYLMTFSLPKPLLLIKTDRQEIKTVSHKVVTYRYAFLPDDIGDTPFLVPFPSILWRMRDEQDVHTVAPEPAKIAVRSILNKNSELEPQKGLVSGPANERIVLFWLPALTAGILFGGVGLYSGFQLVQYLRARKNKKPLRRDTDKPLTVYEPVYETSRLARWRLQREMKKAMEKYKNSTDADSLTVLRNLFARCAVSRLRGDARVDRKTACAMTADELLAGGGDKIWVGKVRAIDERLEAPGFSGAKEQGA